jgi:hypothetical protein
MSSDEYRARASARSREAGRLKRANETPAEHALRCERRRMDYHKLVVKIVANAPPWVAIARPRRRRMTPSQNAASLERIRRYREENAAAVKQRAYERYHLQKQAALDPKDGVLGAYLQYLNEAEAAGEVPR